MVQLYAGLLLYGLSTACRIRASLGLDPWGAFHEGVARRLGISFGSSAFGVGALILLLWWPLRQKPGLGTISNIVVIGWTTDLSLGFVPEIHGLMLRSVVLLTGIVMTGIATSAYIGAGLGPGPRDGVMTGLASRLGRPVGPVRTGMELIVLACGWLLGGTVGAGTLVYALMIGWVVQHMLPALTLE